MNLHILCIEAKEIVKKFDLCDVVASVLCVNAPKGWGLTIGKKYEIINENVNFYVIINDLGVKDIAFKHYFKKL